VVCAPLLLPGWACSDWVAGDADVHLELWHSAGTPGHWDGVSIGLCVLDTVHG